MISELSGLRDWSAWRIGTLNDRLGYDRSGLCPRAYLLIMQLSLLVFVIESLSLSK